MAGTAGCRAICQALTSEGRDPQAERRMDGTWCALGTSIAWYDVNVDKSGGRLACGYPTYVMRKLTFDGYRNDVRNGTFRICVKENDEPFDFKLLPHCRRSFGCGMVFVEWGSEDLV